MEIGLWQGVVFACCVVGAAWVRGYSGFGFSALVITSAGLVLDPVPLVPVLVMCEVALTLGQARGLRGNIDWRRTWTMLAGAVVVMPFSFTLIASLGQDAARVAISALVLMLCGAMFAGWRFRSEIGTGGNVLAGMASGLANGAAMSGLPLVVFLASQPIAVAVLRATLIAYLTLVGIAALPILWKTGLLVGESFVLLAAMVPPMALGLWLGGRRFQAASPKDFRRFTLIVLSLLAAGGLLRSAAAAFTGG